MTARKKPRTAAQKAATKKLIAFNKARKSLNKKRAKAPARKRKTARTAKQKAATRKLVALNKTRRKYPASKGWKRAKKTTRRKSSLRNLYCVFTKARIGGVLKTYYFDGSNLTTDRKLAMTYTTRDKAGQAMMKIQARLPKQVMSFGVTVWQ